MSKLILLRHGCSKWNEQNRFTGWVDVPLSDKGFLEAQEAAKKIARFPIDRVFVSALIRAQMTAMIVLNEHTEGKTPCVLHSEGGKMQQWGKIYSEKAEKNTLPVVVAWQLNERMYGELQGHNKDEMRSLYGEEQIKIWRRSFDVAPPGGESLFMTARRSIPYFEQEIIPCLKKGENVFVCAHGNSLRSIIMDIEKLTKEQVINLELETGVPVVYEYKNGMFTKEI